MILSFYYCLIFRDFSIFLLISISLCSLGNEINFARGLLIQTNLFDTENFISNDVQGGGGGLGSPPDL